MLSDNGDAVEDDVDVDESSEEAKDIVDAAPNARAIRIALLILEVFMLFSQIYFIFFIYLLRKIVLSYNFITTKVVHPDKY